MADTASNSSLILLASCTGTPDTTASTYQKGCILYVTDTATSLTGVYQNTGTSTSPVWTGFQSAGLRGVILYGEDTGGNNNIVTTIYAVGTTLATLQTGTTVGIHLHHTLQAGANSVNVNGTNKSLVSATNLLNIDTTFAVGGFLTVTYLPGVAGGVFVASGHNV